MSDPGKGHWRELVRNVIETPGWHESVDELHIVRSMLRAIKKSGFRGHCAKVHNGGWQVWATAK